MGSMDFLIFFVLFTLSAASRDYVPVLIWSTEQPSKLEEPIPGLSKMDADDFSNYLLKKTNVDMPNILVFIEENLSLEDFSWRDVNEEIAFPLLSNITKFAEDFTFVPSVQNPYKAIRRLRNHGYSLVKFQTSLESLPEDEASIIIVKLKEPDPEEGRPDLLRSHDEEMADIYSRVLEISPNLMCIYTGNHSSWIDADIKYTRIKRNEPEDFNYDDAPTSDTLILSDSNRSVLIYTHKPIFFHDGDETANLTDTTMKPTVEKQKDRIILDVNFKYKNMKPEVDFYFRGSENNNWELSYAIANEKKDQILEPSMHIEAPNGYSFRCGRSLVFTDKEKKTVVQLHDFQVQPFTKDGKFGPAIDCVPYFSIAIWSGIFVTILLTLVLAWGIIMIMDINTMDRFDDAKEKTITITTVD